MAAKLGMMAATTCNGAAMLLLIDNYDSFTFNLYHFLGDLGVVAQVHRNDALTVQDAMALKPKAIVLSPGPCDPDKAGICLGLIGAAAQARVPLLGVCLGEQALGQAMGGKVVRAPVPMHGKLSSITHDGTGIFEGVPSPLEVTRYHSLVVDRASLPASLRITAESEDGLIMGLEHRELPHYGVQFHPESIASQCGHEILANFLRLAGYDVTDCRQQAA